MVGAIRHLPGSGKHPHGLNTVSNSNFGLLIAYVLPGYVLIWGVGPIFGGPECVFCTDVEASLSLGDFFNTTLAAIAAGLTLSTLRWMFLDSIHHWTGLRPPRWDFSLLGERADAFRIVVEHYYRYYQFQANTFVSLLGVFALRRVLAGANMAGFEWLDLGLLALAVMFFVGSRDSLRRYYTRGGQLLSRSARKKGRSK